MATVAPTSIGGLSVNAAKRKFFQRQNDPYAEWYRPRIKAEDHGGGRGDARKSPPNRESSSSSTCTVYGSAFSPPYRNKRYIVACTSNGCVTVWDPRSSSSCAAAAATIPREDRGEQQHGSLTPMFSVRVAGGDTRINNRVLYDLQFVETSNGEHLLVVSGDPGVVVYEWAEFEQAIDFSASRHSSPSKKPKCQDPQNKGNNHSLYLGGGPFVDMDPLSTFRPHPSPASSFGECVEMNSFSFCKSSGSLFGAAGDAFGCYRWDLATEKLLGTFGGAGKFDGGGHRDYLHVVKTIPVDDGGGGPRYVITGGEDGNMGFWSKDGKLIEMANVKTVMEKNKDLVTSNTMSNSRSFMVNSLSPWNNGSSLWVSSMDTNGDWLAVCGGAESACNSIASRSGPNTSGFAALWHLPTRSFTAGCTTRESVNAVVYNPAMDCFVSGGNEGRISFWESTTLARSGRSWSTPSAAYTVSVDPESNKMVVGGSGGTMDCFVDRVKVSQLHVTS